VTNSLRFLLLQVRNSDDPMRHQEVACFARALDVPQERIGVFDLLGDVPGRRQLDAADVVLLGGSGDYSVAKGGSWIQPALDAMRELHDEARPTFASCWGFQAMAQALGGAVVNDLDRAEIGSNPVRLTDAGRSDPVFHGMPEPFLAVMGHEDIVDRLPPDALLLASTDRVTNQAFTFPGKPIYCTQFHPELNREGLLQRLRAYPRYVQRIAGISADEFEAQCRECDGTERILRRFVSLVFA